jgi:hypothetical protein
MIQSTGDDTSTQDPQAMQLRNLLEEIAAMQAEKKALESALSALKAKMETSEGLAVELMNAYGLDGVRAAGKSWGTREAFHLSVLADNRQKVVEAANAAGLGRLVESTVNTTTLKAWLLERREGGSGDEPLAAGTPFDGLVSEFREVRLSHRKVD